MPQVAILDVDGTLVDTNYHHAIAWFRAFRRHFLTLQVWRIHRHIGMGGDQLVAALAGDEVEERLGDSIREAESDLYRELIGEVQAMEGSRRLIEDLKDADNAVVLASSAKEWEVKYYLGLLDAAEIVDASPAGQYPEQHFAPQRRIAGLVLQHGSSGTNLGLAESIGQHLGKPGLKNRYTGAIILPVAIIVFT